jgi:hypothetical protein
VEFDTIINEISPEFKTLPEFHFPAYGQAGFYEQLCNIPSYLPFFKGRDICLLLLTLFDLNQGKSFESGLLYN